MTALVLAVAGVVVWLALRHTDRAAAPALYTNKNSGDVWVHPAKHLGARVDVHREAWSAVAPTERAACSGGIRVDPLSVRARGGHAHAIGADNGTGGAGDRIGGRGKDGREWERRGRGL